MIYKKSELCQRFVTILFLMSLSTIANASDSPPALGQEGISAEFENGRITISIAPSSLGKDFLIVRDGSDQKLVRWIRENDKVQLVVPITETVIGADDHPGARLGGAMLQKWLPSTLQSFPITGTATDGSLEFDATTLFVSEIDGLLTVQGDIDRELSRVNKVSSFRNLVEVASTHTLSYSNLSEYYQQRYPANEPLSLSVYWSIIQLPDLPMRPRKYDARMGFFIDKHDLSQPDFSVGTMRWRLEKANPLQPVSKPKKPISFTLGNDSPAWLKPWLKAGINQWLSAFEAAGFEDAIEVHDAPANDPNFDYRSLRYSVIKLVDSSNVRFYNFDMRGEPRGGGTVDTVYDPRTGEILKSNIVLPFPNDSSVADFFAFCGALDSRAARIPLPKSLTGELLEVTTAHEAGHAFGLMDGDYGEFVYPTAKLRDEQWLARMGFSPSVMNYSRCNYVAQPEDDLPIEYILPRVGPADIHHIRWGYTAFPQAATWRDEQPYLEKIVNEIETSPWLRYAVQYQANEISPQLYNDAIDVADPIAATKLGLKNLQRSIKMLPAATLHDEGSNALLEQMYFRILKHWSNMMGHVSSMIGGYTKHYKSGPDVGPVFTPIPANQQREAVAYLAETAFQTPAYLIDIDITRRFEASGTIDNISSMQARLLDQLLSVARLKNFGEFELSAASTGSVYRTSEYLADIHAAIWSELDNDEISIDPYRQRLQAAHIKRLKQLIGVTAEQSNIASLLQSELDVLEQEIVENLAQTQASNMRAHLKLMLKAVKSE